MRRTRGLVVVMSAALLVGVVAGAPAEAKKKKRKPPKPAVCAPYVPGELSAGQPLALVTDAATESTPLLQQVTLDAAITDLTLGLDPTGTTDPSIVYFNVQVDSAAPEAGLYGSIEFPTRRDYDIWFRWSDGSEAGSSHAFNTVYPDPTGLLSASGNGGEPTDASETIVGIRTPDCVGYTMEVGNYLGEGGDFDVKLWLGEAVNEPLAPAGP